MIQSTMSNYNIHVYKIWWEDKDDIYIGSTKQRLAVRMAGHRALCKKNSQFQLYKHMRKLGVDFNYVLLETKSVVSCDEKRKLEQEYIDKLKPSLNSKRACYDPKMWTDNKKIKIVPKVILKIIKKNKEAPKTKEEIPDELWV